MFERYTEQARLTIFHARYEASNLGSAYIETEHLLLGIMPRDAILRRKFDNSVREEIRKQIEESRKHPIEKILFSVDLPLSREAKAALGHAAEEATAMGHREIDTGHLVLGLLRVPDCGAAGILRQHGIKEGEFREAVRARPEHEPAPARAPRERAVERSGLYDEPGALTSAPAAKSLQAPIAMLAGLLDETISQIGAYTDAYADQHLKRKPWTRREAMGHLVDWATTHHHWFVRALSEPRLIIGVLPQDDWVTAQDYRTFSWLDLVDLWVCLNRLLIHVLTRVPEAKASRVCRIGIEDPITLKELVRRYVAHCEDIVGQVLMRL